MRPTFRDICPGDLLPALVRSQRGQDLVEFALILPLLLLLTFGIIDFGRAIFSFNTIVNAAREGARYGVIHPTDTAGITSRALQLAAGLQCDGGPKVQSTAGGTSLVVKVDCTLHLITGIVPQALGGSATIPLHAEASMRVERVE